MTRAITTRLVGIAVVGAAALAAGCTMKDQKVPALTGPSELGTSITLTALPDAIHQDGASQSLITATVRDANGQPVRNAALRTEIRVGGVMADFGGLSAKNVVTGSDGRATFVYTAPPSVSSQESVDTGMVVDIAVTPQGTDFNNAFARTVAIRLLPVGVVLPPNAKPVANFTFSPATATENVKILFDASSSTDSDGQIVSYAWTFGDGDSGTGVTISRAYSQSGTYNVTLTVTDDRGQTGTTTRQVSIGQAAGISAKFNTSPAAPIPNQTVFFNASESTPSAGHAISSYTWDFGDGSTGSGVTTSHAYTTVGSYTVTLTVTDDAGKTASTTLTLAVGSSNPTAAFTFSPTDPLPGSTVNFNASTSQAAAGRRIVSYTWDFGDGSALQTTSSATISHPYGASENTYTVTLTVTDDVGKTGTTSKTVPVKFPTVGMTPKAP